MLKKTPDWVNNLGALLGTPGWVLKFGIIGTIFFLIFSVIWKIIDWIFEFEIQTIYQERIKIWLIEPVFSITINGWTIFGSTMVLTAIVVITIAIVYYYKILKPNRRVYTKFNKKSLKLPSAIEGADNQKIRVIRAFNAVREDKLELEHFTKIVEDALNSGSISDDFALGILSDYSYRIYLNHDRSWSVEKIRKGEINETI